MTDPYIRVSSDYRVIEMRGLKKRNCNKQYLVTFTNNLAKHSNGAHQQDFEFLYDEHRSSSFFYYDPLTGKFICQRDIIGEGSVFYLERNGELIISNKIHHLFDNPGDLILCPESILYYLTFQYFPFDRCAFKNVKKLMPGERIELSQGSRPEHNRQPILRYADSNSHNPDLDAQAVLSNVFSSIHIDRQKHTTGLFLSGGTDSTTNLQIAHLNSLKPILLTAGFGNNKNDEKLFAVTANEQTNFEHLILEIPKHSVNDLSKYAKLLKEPICDRAMIPTNYLLMNCRDSISTLISGEGGDELWGPPRRWHPSLESMKDQRSLFGKYIELSSCATLKVRNTLMSNICNVDETINECVDRCINETMTSGARTNYERIKALVMSTWFPDNVVCKEVSAAGPNRKVLFPLVHESCLDFVGNRNQGDVFEMTSDKQHLKGLLSQYFDERVTSKKKQKFKVPSELWLTQEFSDYFNNTVCSTNGALSNSIDLSELRKIANYPENHNQSNDRLIWGVFCLHEWILSINRKVSSNEERVPHYVSA